jgi:hypothetical protein
MLEMNLSYPKDSDTWGNLWYGHLAIDLYMFREKYDDTL